VGLLLAGTLAGTLGCAASAPAPPDTEIAHETLRTALDAWKSGETPEALRDRKPTIFVADHEWTGGVRLLDYQVDAKDVTFGPSLRCQVQLSIQDKRGKTRRKKAVYSVSTHQILSVVREDVD
jgi:hypothetical protein